MQCFWQLPARLPPHGLRRAPTLAQAAAYRVRSSRFASTAAATTPSFPFPQTQPSASATPSRLALAATHAVHKSVKDQALEQGFYIVNSLRYAALPESKQQHQMWDQIRTSLLSVPPGVSPRLPAHALMHGLLRIGMPQQASALATSVMSTGLHVRCKTLEKIVGGLAQRASETKADEARLSHFKQYMADLLATPKILSLNSSMTSNRNTAFALELLQAAKENGNHRSNVLFNTLITLCLINGEIILAALLFGILVKDWEYRSTALTHMTATLPDAPQAVPRSPIVNHARRYDLMTKRLEPQPETLKEIMVPIREKLANAQKEDVNTPEFQEALQSLAYIASLLDERKLPFGRVSSVLHALVNCPTVDSYIWRVRVGEPKPVCYPANRYFHKVLLRLMHSLPDMKPRKRSVALLPSPISSINFCLVHPVNGLQPPLNLPSYNILIHYALRNRFCPGMAEQIYEHMTVKRKHPLKYTATSHGIFLHAATLYRRRDIVNSIVQTIRDWVGRRHKKPSIKHMKPRFLALPGRFKDAGQSKIRMPPPPVLAMILKDKYLFSIYLSALLSCNGHLVVYKLMLRLLPYFAKYYHYQNSHPNCQIKRAVWNQSVANAAILGPYALCAFVLAVTRVRRLYVLMSLFKMICLASKKSLKVEGKGWHVTVPIYNTVLQARYMSHRKTWRKTPPISLELLIETANRIYDKIMADWRSGIEGMKPTARFYNALLKILAKLIPEPKLTIYQARVHLEEARRRYAETGITARWMFQPLLEKLAVDMQENGYTIPVGFHYMFLGRGLNFSGDHSYIPEIDRRPVAFKKYQKPGGPYSLPVYNTNILPLYGERRVRKLASFKRRAKNW